MNTDTNPYARHTGSIMVTLIEITEQAIYSSRFKVKEEGL
jgi:hypothetical protein